MHVLVVMACLIVSRAGFGCGFGARFQCAPARQKIVFYQIRQCFKSTQVLIAWRNCENVADCKTFILEKKGLAFNFSPPGLKNLTIFRNCQVLGCPEGNDSSLLVPDAAFDYYSAYGNLNATQSAICIKSIGLFAVVQERRNYTEAISYCQSLGADLASVLDETRTNQLALLLKPLKSWYKAAYVGLDDIEVEGTFVSPMGYSLDCTTFRAWSPGHPRGKRTKEDCVILDTERVWRAINCKIKVGFICEFYPEGPQKRQGEFFNINCNVIKNKRKMKKCLGNKELFEIIQNSSRIDQCALMDYS